MLFPLGSSIVINGLVYHTQCDENHTYIIGDINPTPEWVECEKTASYSCDAYQVELFSGDWEGEGAVIIKNQQNEWRIHFDDSENFSFAELRDHKIRLVSKEYPIENEWIVSLNGEIKIEKKAKHLCT